MKPIYTLLLAILVLTACQPQTPEVTHYQSAEMESMNLPFSEAVIVGNMIYLSGQIGNKPGEMKVVEGGIEAETRQTLDNIKRVLEANGSSMEHAIKLTVMMDNMEEWPAMNEVYKTYFPGNKPARSAFGATALALGAKLEIECIAIIP